MNGARVRVRGCARALPSNPPGGFAPLDPPPKGEALWNLLMALMRGVADTGLARSQSATPLINATNRFQGLSPLAEVQEAEPPGGVRGNAPALPDFRRLPWRYSSHARRSRVRCMGSSMA